MSGVGAFTRGSSNTVAFQRQFTRPTASVNFEEAPRLTLIIFSVNRTLYVGRIHVTDDIEVCENELPITDRGTASR